MRVRVTYESLKFIHVVKEASVGELTQAVGERVAAIIGAASPANGGCHLVRALHVAPGFTLEAEQRVEDALRDDDVVLALTEADYLQREEALCARPSANIAMKDLGSNATIAVEVGLHKFNRIYARMRVGRAPVRLETVPMGFAEELPAPGEYLVYGHSGTTKDGKDESKEFEWNASVTAVVEKDSKGSLQVSALLVSLKVSTSPQAEIWRIPVSVSKNGKYSLGQHTVTQQAVVDWLQELSDREMPENSSSGPESLPTKIPRPATPKPFSANVAQGLGGLKVVQAEETFVQQGRSATPGQYITSYWSEFETFLEGSPVIISKVSAEYLDKAGKWVSCPASTGYKRGYAYYGEHNGAYTVPQGASSIALGAWIDGFKFPQGVHERMTPLSMPQPMQFRFTLSTPSGETMQVSFEQVNGEIEVAPATPQDGELGRAACDDHNTLSRMFLAVKKVEGWRPQDKEYLSVIVNGGESRNLFYNDLLTFAHNAKESGAENVPIKGLTKLGAEELFQYSCSAVVDQKRGYCYALKLWIKSPTAEVTQYVRIPPLKH